MVVNWSRLGHLIMEEYFYVVNESVPLNNELHTHTIIAKWLARLPQESMVGVGYIRTDDIRTSDIRTKK